MSEPDETAHAAVVIDVLLAVLLAILVSIGMCGVLRALHLGGRVVYRATSAVGRGAYAVIDFFSKLYQAAFGVLILGVILFSLYFYLTTHDQRASIHESLESVTPTAAGAVKAAMDPENAQVAIRHIKNLAGKFIQ